MGVPTVGKDKAATKGNKRGVGFLRAVCLNKLLLQGYCGVVLSFQKRIYESAKNMIPGVLGGNEGFPAAR